MKIEIIIEKEKINSLIKAGGDYGFFAQFLSPINHHITSVCLIGKFCNLKRFLEDDIFEDYEEPLEALLY